MNNRYYLGLTLSMASDLRVQCPQGGARGQNLEHLIIFFLGFYFSFMDSFVFRQHVLFRVDFLCDFGPQGTVPEGGARGQNLGHLNF